MPAKPSFDNGGHLACRLLDQLFIRALRHNTDQRLRSGRTHDDSAAGSERRLRVVNRLFDLIIRIKRELPFGRNGDAKRYLRIFRHNAGKLGKPAAAAAKHGKQLHRS